jgi:hypothetical protein
MLLTCLQCAANWLVARRSLPGRRYRRRHRCKLINSPPASRLARQEPAHACTRRRIPAYIHHRHLITVQQPHAVLLQRITKLRQPAVLLKHGDARRERERENCRALTGTNQCLQRLNARDVVAGTIPLIYKRRWCAATKHHTTSSRNSSTTHARFCTTSTAPRSTARCRRTMMDDGKRVLLVVAQTALSYTNTSGVCVCIAASPPWVPFSNRSSAENGCSEDTFCGEAMLIFGSLKVHIVNLKFAPRYLKIWLR